ncbi:hypothetical protein CBR_g26157 [Chara braunii]|uniref:Uncharacterized protein n=1 Tax=Chara braunii TaxID=69332 RepID=A0A388JVZ5_CHABU|nr:hypothetical protein CBR_g26157 [Chara braunii]|eukprot:GBG61994.1 hypothetical protein CBR_g26157 [Chara braunii]
MACLALSLQNVQGQDLLLQTRQWFPPVRAAAAATSFKEKRKSSAEGGAEGLGDDAMAAASGQVVVGTDSKCVSRPDTLSSTLYCLEIATSAIFSSPPGGVIISSSPSSSYSSSYLSSSSFFPQW